MAAAADIRASSLPLPGNNNKQKSHKIDNTYQTKESRYNQNRNLQQCQMNDDKRYYQQSYQQMIIVHFLYKLEYQAELIKEENPSEL